MRFTRLRRTTVTTTLALILSAAHGCTSTARPAGSDADLAKRLESAFALEKQRRAGIANPSYAPQNPGADSIAGLRAGLASERQRRTQLEAEVTRLRARDAEQGRANAELVSLRAELAGERNRNRALKKELEQEHEPTEQGPTQAELEALEAQLARERQRRQALETELALLAKGKTGSGESAAEVARLKQQLDQERRRRLEVEKAWSRLREETSVPPFGESSVSEAEFLAVKQELQETRRALDAEREARQKAEARVDTTSPAAPDPKLSNLGQENRTLRDRVTSLQRERDALKRAISELTSDTPVESEAEAAGTSTP